MTSDSHTNLAVFRAAMRQGVHDALNDHAYRPGVEPVEANADHLDGYAAGWDCAGDTLRAHNYAVRADAGHGYPYRAYCPCGWQSRGYVTATAAHDMASDHVLERALIKASE
jgi:hypothetical protein